MQKTQTGWDNMEIFALIGILLVLGGIYHEAKKAMPHGFLNWLLQERPCWHFWHPGSGIVGGALAGVLLTMVGVLVFLLTYWWTA